VQPRGNSRGSEIKSAEALRRSEEPPEPLLFVLMFKVRVRDLSVFFMFIYYYLKSLERKEERENEPRKENVF